MELPIFAYMNDDNEICTAPERSDRWDCSLGLPIIVHELNYRFG